MANNPLDGAHQKSREPSESLDDERLGQIEIFLADEDYFRCLDFTWKVAQIEAYINNLDAPSQRQHARTLVDIRAMIDVHKSWIGRATSVTPLSLEFWKLKIKNRLEVNQEPRPGLLMDEIHQLPNLKKRVWVAPEVPLYIPLDPDKVPQEKDPFELTRKLLKIQKKQRSMLDLVQVLLSRWYAEDIVYVPCNVDPRGPIIPPSKKTIREGFVNRLMSLASLYGALVQAERLAPRPLITTVLINIADGMAKDGEASSEDHNEEFKGAVLDTPLSGLDLYLLGVLTEPSRHSKEVPLDDLFAPDLTEREQGRFKAFVNAMKNSFNSGVWPSEEDSWISIDILVDHISAGLDLTFDMPEIRLYLTVLSEGNHIVYDGDKGVKRLSSDYHPENRYFSEDLPDTDAVRYNGNGDEGPPLNLDHRFFAVAAARLGRTMRLLKKDLEDEQSDLTFNKRVTGMIAAFKAASHNPKTSTDAELMAAAETITTTGRELTKADAVRLIQDKALEELNRNWRPREHDRAKIWEFAKMREPPAEKYFSITRWPVSLQREDRQAEIRASGPVREKPLGSLRLTAEEKEYNRQREADLRDPRMKWIRGDTTMPFGETLFQQAVMGYGMEQELHDVPELAWSSSRDENMPRTRENADPYALPALRRTLSGPRIRKEWDMRDIDDNIIDDELNDQLFDAKSGQWMDDLRGKRLRSTNHNMVLPRAKRQRPLRTAVV